MHTRRFLVILALLGVTLACNLPGMTPEETFQQTLVKRVTVNPASGSGSFTLEVTHNAGSESISCYYVTPDGASMGIGNLFIWEFGNYIETLTFTVTTPGDYTATCENDSSTSKASAQFTVTQAPPVAPAGNPMVILDPSQIRHAVLTLAIEQAHSNLDPFKPVHSCWPPNYYDDGNGFFTVSQNGTLNGSCSYQHEWTMLGTLTGNIDWAKATVNFHLEGRYNLSNPTTGSATWIENLDGVGSFTSPTEASGTANWSLTCTASGERIRCSSVIPEYNFSVQATGTVPWSMLFSP